MKNKKNANENKNLNQTEIQESHCKNCGKTFKQNHKKGRPQAFCGDKCRDEWGKEYHRQRRIKCRRKASRKSHIYLTPVVREDLNVEQLARVLLSIAMTRKNLPKAPKLTKEEA